MPLTRNLYREEEINSALQYAILKGRIQESVFWAHEAIQSNMRTEVMQIIFWLWMNFFGASNLSWYNWFHAASTDDDIYYLVISLGRAIKRGRGDSTVFALVVGCLVPSSDKPGFVVLPPALRDLKGEERAFASAIKQGKLFTAFEAAKTWTNTTWQILEVLALKKAPYIKLLAKEPSRRFWDDEWLWFTRALAISIASSPDLDSETEAEPIPVEFVGCYRAWENCSMLDARAYSIPSECLYWFCERGCIQNNKTTEEELTGGLEAALHGSKFWNTIPQRTDDQREELFRYFTSDIPDEWSKENRLKSHGYGVVPTGADVNYEIMLERCMMRWFSAIPSRGILAGMESAIKILVSKKPRKISEFIHMEYEVTRQFTKMELD
jgi:hypothetical protein